MHEPKSDFQVGDSSKLLDRSVLPMDAVHALYSERDHELSRAIVESLSSQIFKGPAPSPANRTRRSLAKLFYRVLRRTTRQHIQQAEDGSEVIAYKNRVLERSRHPYALTLLAPSSASSATFVEGGDPMNAPYMMISPEIRQNGGRWDRLLLDSLLGRDVQLRFTYETLATYQAAREHLVRGEPVRLKAAAAGTGLSMVLAYDRLLRDGFSPDLITALITDRDQSNVIKTGRLLDALPTTAPHRASDAESPGISARTEDVLDPADGSVGDFDIVTLVGILEYFRGHTCATMEDHHGIEHAGDENEGLELITSVAGNMATGGRLITNTYRPELGGRTIEIFGKRLRYRRPEDLQRLVATGGFIPTTTAGRGHVYDIELFEKRATNG